MKSKTANSVNCSTCRDHQYVVSNKKGKVQATACKCFDCELCQGTGRILAEGADGISRISECQCADFSKKLKLFNQAGIPGPGHRQSRLGTRALQRVGDTSWQSSS